MDVKRFEGNTPYQPAVSISHPINPHYQFTLSTHIINITPYQFHNSSTHHINTHYQHIRSTQLINILYNTFVTHPLIFPLTPPLTPSLTPPSHTHWFQTSFSVHRVWCPRSDWQAISVDAVWCIYERFLWIKAAPVKSASQICQSSLASQIIQSIFLGVCQIICELSLLG